MRILEVPSCLQRGCALALCAALALAPAIAAAEDEREDLARARALFTALDYEESYTAFGDALKVQGNRPGQLVDIYRHLGIIAASMDRPSEAADFFQRMLLIDPRALNASDLPPKLLGPFLVAQNALQAQGGFRLTTKPPTRTAGALELSVELEPDAIGLANGVTLRVRPAASPRYQAFSVVGAGPLRFSVPAAVAPPDRDVEYYFEVTNSYGGVLRSTGSATEPLRIAALVASPVSDEEAPAWYRSGWVWLAAGGAATALVAGGVALAIAAPWNALAPSVQVGSVESEVARLLPASARAH